MVAEKLDLLQSRFAACKTIAFADISTGMVLATSTNTKLDYSELNDLCIEAGLLLGTADKSAIGAGAVNSAIRQTPTETVVFLRSDSKPNELLLGVCAPGIDTGRFFADALVCLSTIGVD